MSGIVCACASEECAVFGCQRIRRMYEERNVQQPVAQPCNCIGPQNGQPLCPCQMKGVTVKDGRHERHGSRPHRPARRNRRRSLIESTAPIAGAAR